MGFTLHSLSNHGNDCHGRFFDQTVATTIPGFISNMYHVLDKFFFVFHSVIIVFNLLGWMWKKTRRANLILLTLTACSWFGLGIWYGVGYCPCTDWHWQVRRELGHFDMPASYIKFIIDAATGLDVRTEFADGLTVTLFVLALGASIYVNMKDRMRAG